MNVHICKWKVYDARVLPRVKSLKCHHITYHTVDSLRLEVGMPRRKVSALIFCSRGKFRNENGYKILKSSSW